MRPALPDRIGWCALALAVCGCSFSAAALDVPAGQDATDATASDASIRCPATYTLKFNGHSYRTVVADMYANLVASCHADGQYVVAINDSSENTWALSQLTSINHYVWIGLHFTAPPATWTWDDGTPLGAGFESFAGAPPTNPSDPCADAYQTDGSWASYTCAAVHPTLCECNGP